MREDSTIASEKGGFRDFVDKRRYGDFYNLLLAMDSERENLMSKASGKRGVFAKENSKPCEKGHLSNYHIYFELIS